MYQFKKSTRIPWNDRLVILLVPLQILKIVSVTEQRVIVKLCELLSAMQYSTRPSLESTWRNPGGKSLLQWQTLGKVCFHLFGWRHTHTCMPFRWGPAWIADCNKCLPIFWLYEKSENNVIHHRNHTENTAREKDFDFGSAVRTSGKPYSHSSRIVMCT